MHNGIPCEHKEKAAEDVYCHSCSDNRSFMALSFKVADIVRERLFDEVVNYIDWEWDEKKIKSYIDVAFNEALQNAVEHGILGIDYERKSRALKESPDEFYKSVKERWAKKGEPVNITLCVTDERILLGFHDNGKGFDYKKYSEKTFVADSLLEQSGRGIPLLKGMGIQLYWNKKGNSAYCAITSNLLQPSRTKEKRLVKRRGKGKGTCTCTISIGGHKAKGKLINHSLAGAEIRYGGVSLPVNTDLHLASDKLKIDRHAKVVWCKKVDKKDSLIGLKFI